MAHSCYSFSPSINQPNGLAQAIRWHIILLQAAGKLEWRRIVDLDCFGGGVLRIEEDATFLLNHHRGYQQRRRLQAFLPGRTEWPLPKFWQRYVLLF